MHSLTAHINPDHLEHLHAAGGSTAHGLANWVLFGVVLLVCVLMATLAIAAALRTQRHAAMRPHGRIEDQ